MNYSNIKPKEAPTATIPPELIKRGEDLSLCFWLGFSLPIYGLVISAIILKGDGVRKALSGMFLAAILSSAVALIAFVLNC